VRYEVIIQPSAEGDMESAYQWIAERAPEEAVKWYNGVLDACLALETLPERCPKAPESKGFKREIRQLIYGKRHYAFRILFTVSGQTVQILHVRRGARQTLPPPRTTGGKDT
jgi:plasmid stabilization system protein ParE